MCIGLEDLGCAILRAVVGRDHEVDTRVQVERDLRIDDLRLVAGKKRHDEPHGESTTLARTDAGLPPAHEPPDIPAHPNPDGPLE